MSRNVLSPFVWNLQHFFLSLAATGDMRSQDRAERAALIYSALEQARLNMTSIATAYRAPDPASVVDDAVPMLEMLFQSQDPENWDFTPLLDVLRYARVIAMNETDSIREERWEIENIYAPEYVSEDENDSPSSYAAGSPDVAAGSPDVDAAPTMEEKSILVSPSRDVQWTPDTVIWDDSSDEESDAESSAGYANSEGNAWEAATDDTDWDGFSELAKLEEMALRASDVNAEMGIVIDNRAILYWDIVRVIAAFITQYENEELLSALAYALDGSWRHIGMEVSERDSDTLYFSYLCDRIVYEIDEYNAGNAPTLKALLIARDLLDDDNLDEPSLIALRDVFVVDDDTSVTLEDIQTRYNNAIDEKSYD